MKKSIFCNRLPLLNFILPVTHLMGALVVLFGCAPQTKEFYGSTWDGIEFHTSKMSRTTIPKLLVRRSTLIAMQDLQTQQEISELNCTGDYRVVSRGESLLNLDFPELNDRLTNFQAMHYCRTEVKEREEALIQGKHVNWKMHQLYGGAIESGTLFAEGSYAEWRSEKSTGWVVFTSSNVILDPPIFMRKTEELFLTEPSAQKNLSRLYASGGAKSDFDRVPYGYTNVIDRYDQPPYQCMRFALTPTYFDDYDPYPLALYVYPAGYSTELDLLGSRAYHQNMVDWTSRWIEPYTGTSQLIGFYCVIREEKFPRDKAEVRSVLALISVKESITHGSLNSARFGFQKSTGWH